MGCEKKAAILIKPKKTLALVKKADTIAAVISVMKPYSDLVLDTSFALQSAYGTKSVLFNSDGSRLYALNLEELSVYEFDRGQRKKMREFKFKPTIGEGWSYENAHKIISYQEKPVEAAISNHDSILWVSLHNAEGIVPILLNDVSRMKSRDSLSKELHVVYTNGAVSDTIFTPLIKTGKTPKVIAVDANSRNLLVSNWHSHTTSILSIDPAQSPYAHLLRNVSMGAIPRGILVDNLHNKSYVALMGGSQINVINTNNWEQEAPIKVASNPRHLVMDNKGRLFVSYNMLSQVACIDPVTGQTLFSASTESHPRTIVLSKNSKFLFVTCYKGNKLDVFKIGDNGFTKIYSLDSKGSPVGVDVFEDDNTLEAWVCNYTIGAIKVFKFQKQQDELNLAVIKKKK